jgi:hypothetical protein
MRTERASELEIGQAICRGEVCRTDTTHCHAGDHFSEAYRVRKLLDRCALGSGGATGGDATGNAPPRGEDKEPTNRAPTS